MSADWTKRLRETPEGEKLLERERLWMEAMENVCHVLERDEVTRAELARRLGTSQAHVTQILSGRRNLTLATLSDVFWALGRSAHISYGPPTERVQVHEESAPLAREWTVVHGTGPAKDMGVEPDGAPCSQRLAS